MKALQEEGLKKATDTEFQYEMMDILYENLKEYPMV
jgi:hypothetical protein